MRTTATLMAALVLAGACGDAPPGRSADGSQSVTGGTSGAGGRGGAGAATGGAGGVGPSGGGGSAANAGSGTATNPPGGSSGGKWEPRSCQEAVDLGGGMLPDAGHDECLACLVDNCCYDSLAIGCLTAWNSPPDVSCYRDWLGAIRECFSEAAHEADDAGTLDAVWESGRWDALAVCAPPDSLGPMLEGGVLACAVGSWPYEHVRHLYSGGAGILPDGGHVDIDGASLYHPLFPEGRCADECFPGWQ